jgi:UDP-N-acetylglucosamine diphosphorylase/glucosamine-1-phosphate N-acetyltransferase
MKIILLYDTPVSRQAFYPLSLTRPVCKLRHGILTILEWWKKVTGFPVFPLTESFLSEEMVISGNFLCVDATVMPDGTTLQQLLGLENGASLEDEKGMIGFTTDKLPAYNQLPVWSGHSVHVGRQKRLQHVWQLFQTNAEKIRIHYNLLSNGRQTSPISTTNTLVGNGSLFLEEGVTLEGCAINTTEGPVYIGKGALVMEGSLIRGPVSIGEGAVVKMGTRLYPGTTIGPFCTAGGEIKNSILMAYSNKAHDGYLGDSVIGEWCNFGAGSSNSNVKNTGGEVKMWDQQSRSFVVAGNKCGLIMGDYSRCAINSSINTRTTIGVSCNVFDGTYPEKHLPSFSWGNHERYEFHKACTDAANWKKMKGMEFTGKDRLILQRIFDAM